MDEPVVITDEIHRQLAVDLFNQTWNLMEQEERTEEDTRTMVNSAHASLYHWRRVGTPLHVQRGEWLISRVYILVGAAEAASDHAAECLRLTEEHGFKGFDLAYAHEAVARAAACSGEEYRFQEHLAFAKQAGAAIEEEEDRTYFQKDLGSGPWFGLQ